jgi:hypothetical protein
MHGFILRLLQYFFFYNYYISEQLFCIVEPMVAGVDSYTNILLDMLMICKSDNNREFCNHA